MRHGILLLLAGVSLSGCKPAERFGPVKAAKESTKKERPQDDLKKHWVFMLPKEAPDVPIVFVANSAPEWKNLTRFWNLDPSPALGARTAHLGQAPLGVAVSLAATLPLDTIKIKVPLGLPDPTPHIPPGNLPTYTKWRLGKRLFYDRIFQSGPDRFSCATCHQPAHGFAEEWAVTLQGNRNTLSLLNVVYNRQQFWDGRVGSLEEVLARSLEDELPVDASDSTAKRQRTHRWGGLVKTLAGDSYYQFHFKEQFGIAVPTQDAIAKVLATYLRTLLSAGSLYDYAEQERQARGAAELSAQHFSRMLDAATQKALGVPKEKSEDVANKLERGLRLFHGSARCGQCHKGPLFTDQDYHNIGIGESEEMPLPGDEKGRFAFVPIGMKESRLIGAFRTPTLRNLPRTYPYFHDGSRRSLKDVVNYYDHAVFPSAFLAQPLRAGLHESVSLHLSDRDKEALALFLRALDGEPVDPIVLEKREK
ncbi:MAG: hypothetical protein L0215_05420 [Gemmataceae bacterium]|nr:hypothetical protein [Gemmataceae bacterium]